MPACLHFGRQHSSILSTHKAGVLQPGMSCIGKAASAGMLSLVVCRVPADSRLAQFLRWLRRCKTGPLLIFDEVRRALLPLLVITYQSDTWQGLGHSFSPVDESKCSDLHCPSLPCSTFGHHLPKGQQQAVHWKSGNLQLCLHIFNMHRSAICALQCHKAKNLIAANGEPRQKVHTEMFMPMMFSFIGVDMHRAGHIKWGQHDRGQDTLLPVPFQRAAHITKDVKVHA